MKGLDCSAPLTAEIAQGLKAQGYGFIARYLWQGGKAITYSEAHGLLSAGLQILSVYEGYGSREMTSTAAQGLLDGARALGYAREIRQPQGSVLYFAIDYDAQPSDMDGIAAYLHAIDSVTPGYPIGVYGSYDLCAEMKKRGVCRYFWQTYAWSGGKRFDGAQVYQYQNGVTILGVEFDLNDSTGNEGFWSNFQPFTLSVETANETIKLLQGVYAFVTTDEERKHIGVISDELRVSSGQPKQNS